MATSEKVFLAVDLGASGGRVIAGLYDGRALRLEEVHRFDNGPVLAAERMYWDLLGLWTNIQDGLRASDARYGDRIVGVGVDTWGVDFGLLGRGEELLGNPYHYRDRRTVGMMDRAFRIVPREEIFAETGLQFMELNTLYQLVAMKEADSPLLEAAERLLMMPDLFHWLLTGVKVNEMTDVTTTQLYNPLAQNWSESLIERFGLPAKIFGEIAPPGTRLGRLRPEVAETTGLTAAEVILPGAHDTASAVMAAPASQPSGGLPDWCYISSGTWSLMGAEVPQPIINDQVSGYNFTNEGGVGGTIRLLKNIAGMWLVQECRRIWRLDGRDYTWERLVELASASEPLVSHVDPDDPSLVAPKNMPEAIREFCRRTMQPVPDSDGSIIRCALESLALRYRWVLSALEEIIGRRIETIHIVGGGSQNRQLCQMAADACRRTVVAGPVEATAIGNLLMQAVAMGEIGSIGEAREMIRRSFPVEQYEPQHPDAWDEAYARFLPLLGQAAG